MKKLTDLNGRAEHKKGRYMSFRNEGQETYVEDINKDGDIDTQERDAFYRLTLLRKAMPNGTWTITIEEEWAVAGYKTLAEVK